MARKAWPERRPLMRELVQKISLDLIGTQEGLFQQLNDLAADAESQQAANIDGTRNAVEFAEASPEPALSELFTDIYAD